MKDQRVIVWLAALVLAAGCAKKSGNSRAENTGAADSSRAPATASTPGDTIGRGPWRWVATVTPVKRIACINPDVYTIELLPDSTLRAVIDCNRGGGRYRVEGSSIRIGPLAATRMMCPPGSMDVTFGRELDAARTWFMQADTLMLDLMADSGTMRFIR